MRGENGEEEGGEKRLSRERGERGGGKEKGVDRQEKGGD